jgi:hypothetical protein
MSLKLTVKAHAVILPYLIRWLFIKRDYRQFTSDYFVPVSVQQRQEANLLFGGFQRRVLESVHLVSRELLERNLVTLTLLRLPGAIFTSVRIIK